MYSQITTYGHNLKMKTNASAKTIIKAVENVSASMYDNNVIFRKYPEKITKHVLRFTLRTKDANKPGSMVTKAGQHQPKANWEVHENVMKEIFELNPRNNIYVDTLYGRQFNEHPLLTYIPDQEEEAQAVEEQPVKRNQTQDYSKRKRISGKFAPQNGHPQKTTRKVYTKKNGLPNMSKLVKTLKYVLAHPDLMDA